MHLSTVLELKEKTRQMKLATLDMCKETGDGYPTSAFSCAEILTVLYYNIMRIDPQNPNWEDRDRFFLSKGHASSILYPILKDRGFFGQEVIDQYLQLGGEIGEQVRMGVPGVDCVSGSLGMGLGVAAGTALGGKMNRRKYFSFCVVGDGECSEGSIWEAAMFAGKYALNNLILFIDRNNVCKTDFTDNIIQLEPLEDKWRAFGWETRHINGHNIPEIIESLSDIRSMRHQKPLAIIADTIKGNGVDFMSNDALWHGVMPKGEQFENAYLQISNE